MADSQLLIVIPTFREAQNVRPLAEQIFAHVPTAHLLFVDDNSDDGTRECVEELIERYSDAVHLLSRPRKLGLGSAYIAGFRYALERSYEYVIEMDADFSHNPEYLPLMQQLLSEAEVVVGSRNIPGGGVANWHYLRRWISRGGSWYAKVILGTPVADMTGGFNGWSRRVLQHIDIDTLSSDGYAFQIELKYRAFRAGFRIREFPILFLDRRAGRSKMSVWILLEAVWRVWTFKLYGWRRHSNRRLTSTQHQD